MTKRITMIVLLSGCLAATPCVASEVFQWTDEDGVVHFSQWKPDNTPDVTTLQLTASNQSEYDPADDPYSIRNQAERMNETWSKLEQRKEERRKAREDALERSARSQPVYYYPEQPYYPYYRRSYYPPVVRPPINKPVHPGYRRKVQRYQVAAADKYNARSHSRTAYSVVTGVSQRASIQSFPGMARRNP